MQKVNNFSEKLNIRNISYIILHLIEFFPKLKAEC